jgi:hypothetical protein
VRLLSNATAIRINGRVPFVATEGVAPYTYEVLPGGAGGSIDSSTGLYVAPSVSGVDTIRATDDNGTEVEKTINVMTPLKLFCDVIQEFMGLDADQVYIYNQKFNIPPDERLYIAIGVGAIVPFSNINRAASSISGMSENQFANFKTTLELNIFSFDNSALDRKEEVVLALNSDYSKKQQELNSFYIAPLTSQFNNLSDIEGSKIPFRFNISVNLQYAYEKVSPIEYYDTFPDLQLVTDPY